MGGAAPAIDAQGNIWVSTGNSALLQLDRPLRRKRRGAQAQPLPGSCSTTSPRRTWYHDNADDFDLSTAPALLPNGLVFVAGKSFSAYTLDASHLGHVGGQLHRPRRTSAGTIPTAGSPTSTALLFVPCRRWAAGGETDRLVASTPRSGIPRRGADSSPIVAGGLVWSIASGDAGNLGNLYALNPTTGRRRADSSTSAARPRTSPRPRPPTG